MFKNVLRVIELRGLQAAGKTTLARKWLEEYPGLARVNRDALREMLFGKSYSPQHEPVVKACETACAQACAAFGYSIIVDDTNLTGSDHWKNFAHNLGMKYETHELHVSVEESIRRDAQRPNPVGPVAIRTTAKRANVRLFKAPEKRDE